MLRELIAKLTGGSGHQDSLIALDRLHINEVLLLKRRISQFDLKRSSDVSRELDHINHQVDLFADTTEAKNPSTEIGLKVLFEEMKDLKESMKAELKELRSVMKKFETTSPLSVGKEVMDIHCGRSFRICKVEKFEDLSLGIVEEICKTDSKAKPRESIIIGNELQSPFSGIRLTVKIKECKDKNARREWCFGFFYMLWRATY